MADERELDLVEVAPLAQPPVCRLLDYGRFKFEALKKDKESRREHSTARLKEMKLRPKISENDFQTKFGYVRNFLSEGDKVKLTIMFRGREMAHQEFGRRLLDRMAEELKDLAVMERNPLVEGRNMIMVLNPLPKKQQGKEKSDGTPEEHPVREAARHLSGPAARLVPSAPAAAPVTMESATENAQDPPETSVTEEPATENAENSQS